MSLSGDDVTHNQPRRAESCAQEPSQLRCSQVWSWPWWPRRPHPRRPGTDRWGPARDSTTCAARRSSRGRRTSRSARSTTRTVPIRSRSPPSCAPRTLTQCWRPGRIPGSTPPTGFRFPIPGCSTYPITGPRSWSILPACAPSCPTMCRECHSRSRPPAACPTIPRPSGRSSASAAA